MAAVNNLSGFRAPNRTQEALDTVLRGLDIATKAYGLYTANEDREALMDLRNKEEERANRRDQRDAEKHARDAETHELEKTRYVADTFDKQAKSFREDTDYDNMQKGRFTPESIAKLLADGFKIDPVKPGTTPGSKQMVIKSTVPGAADLLITQPDPKPVTDPFGRIIAIDTREGGQNVTKYLPESQAAGKTFAAPAPTIAPPRPLAPKQIISNELNDKGEPIQVLREVKPGMSLPKQAPTEKEVREKTITLTEKAEPLRNILLDITDLEKSFGFNLNDYDFKTNSANGKKVDIPGKSVLGIGRVAISNNARALDGKITAIFNAVLADRSGLAVTDAELNRLRDEFRNGKYDNEELLVNALQNYKRRAIQIMQATENAYDAPILKRYKSQQQYTSDSFLKKAGRANEKASSPDIKKADKIKEELEKTDAEIERLENKLGVKKDAKK